MLLLLFIFATRLYGDNKNKDMTLKRNQQSLLFSAIDRAVREEQLYARQDLQRQDIMERFAIGRHQLNLLLNLYSNGQSFPQYINMIRLEMMMPLLKRQPKLQLSEIAQLVGFTCSNMREQFKKKYGVSPAEYRRQL